jgi:pyruvate formate lyase activating enzyme
LKLLRTPTDRPSLPVASRKKVLARRRLISFATSNNVIPGLTDDLDDIGHIAVFAAGLGNVERVDVLPFHQLGRYKWKELRMNYTLADVEPPSEEAVERARAQFRSVGLTAV